MRYWIGAALFCISLHAAAQDKKEKNKEFDENEWRVIDSTDEGNAVEGDIEDAYATDTTVTGDIDSALALDEATEETEDNSTVEQKIRNGTIPYARWDQHPVGDWDESGQARLSIRKVSGADMEELRKMEALNYEGEDKPAAKKEGWLFSLGAWVRANGVLFIWIFYVSLGALLLGVLVLFIRKNDISFRWSSTNKNYGSFDIVKDEGPLNYDALARTSIAEGRLRDAVRFRYLHTLQLLEARQLIAPGKDKTNMDFLRELSRTAFHKPFAALTLHYEYIWYGQLPLSNGQFSQLDDQFAAFTQSIRQHS